MESEKTKTKPKATAKQKKEISDNMSIWEQVCVSDKKVLKDVDVGYKFKTINSTSQVREATKLWGPLGHKWRVTHEMAANFPEAVTDKALIFVVKIHYPTEDGEKFVQQYGSCDWLKYTKKRGMVLDNDAPKKALTDGITKGLSLLGFNADVFLGHWDDKYLAQQEQEKNNHTQANQQKEEFDKKMKRFNKLVSELGQHDEPRAKNACDYLRQNKTVKGVTVAIASVEKLLIQHNQQARDQLPEETQNGQISEDLRINPEVKEPGNWNEINQQMDFDAQPESDEIPY